MSLELVLANRRATGHDIDVIKLRRSSDGAPCPRLRDGAAAGPRDSGGLSGSDIAVQKGTGVRHTDL
jgi:hypothetical protein